LFFYEIINDKWSNKLILLSACQTANGIHIGNYGTTSLSNAFQAAGVQSVIGANWMADDNVSGKITLRFLEYCKKGLETHEALRMAKLDFISNSNDLFTHPYYWAVYTYQGPSQKLFFHNTNNKLFYIIIGVIFGFLILYFVNKIYRI